MKTFQPVGVSSSEKWRKNASDQNKENSRKISQESTRRKMPSPKKSRTAKNLSTEKPKEKQSSKSEGLRHVNRSSHEAMKDEPIDIHENSLTEDSE